MENRFPIVDILDQTPAIPEGCQWAIFLRNHDELTLEMVTDEELIIVLLLSFSAGAVAAFLAVLPGGLRKSIKIKKLKANLLECTRKIEALEKASASVAKIQSDADQEKAGNT